jgi:hypothetical protein
MSSIEGESMASTNETHVGVNCEISYLVETSDSTLKSAVEYLQSDSDFDNLEDLFDPENFTSVIDQVDSVVLFDKNSSSSEVFWKIKSKRNFFKHLPDFMFWFLIFFAVGFLDGISIPNLEIYFLVFAIVVPASLYGFSQLLIRDKVKVPNAFVNLPNQFADVVGTYNFEICGTGLVQLFIESDSELDGKNKALSVLGLQNADHADTVYLHHFISLSELKGIYLVDPETKTRVSGNLVSILRRKFKYSTDKFYLAGYAKGMALALIIPALFLLLT